MVIERSNKRRILNTTLQIRFTYVFPSSHCICLDDGPGSSSWSESLESTRGVFLARFCPSFFCFPFPFCFFSLSRRAFSLSAFFLSLSSRFCSFFSAASFSFLSFSRRMLVNSSSVRTQAFITCRLGCVEELGGDRMSARLEGINPAETRGFLSME